MSAQGLNFQQGHYNDPLAAVQQSLGAGSMFAKTLAGMQEFDQNQQRMDIMRQDRERQAKLDAEHKEEKDLIKKTNADNLDMQRYMLDNHSNYDATDAYNQLEKEGGSKFKEAFFKGDAKAADMQAKLGDTIVNEFMNNQTFAPSSMQLANEYANSHGGVSGLNSDQLKLISSIKDSSLAAKQLIQKDKDALQSQEQAFVAAGKRDEYDKQMKVMDLKVKSLDSDATIRKMSGSSSDGIPGADKFNGAYGNVGKSLYDGVLRNVTDPAVKANVAEALKQMQDKNVNPSIAAAEITRRLSAVPGVVEKGMSQQYKFDSSNISALHGMSPEERLAYDGGKNGIDQIAYAENKKLRENLFAREAELIGKGVGANDSQIADVRSKIARLDRSEGQIYHDEYSSTWNKYLKDNMSGYVDPNIAQQEKINKSISSIVQPAKDPTSITADTGKTGNQLGATNITPISGSAFELLKKFTAQGEGTGYKVYMDHEFKDGKKIDRPATYLGVAVIDANSSIDKHNAKNKTNIPHIGSNIGYSPSSDQKNIISSFADNHQKDSLNMAYKYVGDTGNKDTNDLLAAGSANMLHQYGDNSKVAQRLIAKVVASVKSGNGDEAITTIMKSTYGDAYSDRALAFASAVQAIPGLKTTIKPASLITKYDATSAAARYTATANSLKTSGLGIDDQNQVLANLQNRFSKDKIALKYNIDPLGMTASHTSLSAGEKQKINELTSRINAPMPQQVVPLRELIVKQNDERPLATWFNNLPARYENMVASKTNETNERKDAELKYKLNSERNQMINADKKHEADVSLMISDAGLAKQYKNAKTESAKKLVILAAEQMKKDKENAERGQAIKAGILN